MEKMSRPKEEIYNDVYYKKFEAVWSKLAKRRKPVAKIIKRIETLSIKFAKRNPDHKDRIDECIRLLADTVSKVSKELKRQFLSKIPK